LKIHLCFVAIDSRHFGTAALHGPERENSGILLVGAG
jgi:hypothetical protein